MENRQFRLRGLRPLPHSPRKYGDSPQAKACGSDGADEADTEPWALAHGPSCQGEIDSSVFAA